MTIYNWLLVIIWAIFIIVWLIGSLTAKRQVRHKNGIWGVRIIFSAIVIIFFHSQITNALAALASPHFAPPTHAVLGTIGVIFAAAGIAFAIWARFHLGKNWGMPLSQKVEPALVTSGPYSYVRHPIYSGVLLAILGSVLVTSLVWIVPFVIMAIYFIYSAGAEEELKAKEFPTQYPEYKKHTKMLIPFVF